MGLVVTLVLLLVTCDYGDVIVAGLWLVMLLGRNGFLAIRFL